MSGFNIRQGLYNLITRIREIFGGRYKKENARWPYVVTVIIFLFIVVGGINIFIELTDKIRTDTLSDYDHAITQFFIDLRSPALTEYLLFVTRVGDVYGYLTILIVSVLVTLFVFKKWKYVGQVTLVLALSAISNVILKRAIDRARPGIEHMVSVETLSYPSGHAMSAMAFYGFLIFIFYNYKMNRYLKIGVIMLLVILILSIGISRIYLGVHFPSDIVGGYIAGFIWVIFCVLIFDLIDVFRSDPQT